ncbi:hypothetical protein BJX68DRAFT_227761 [Aspergillus pseudodeflectus]|uniref:Uncharacterized protein n=1 Tax=Aspergillus pseudodeflectus TaxID=176178 RepID=A0ABR4L3G6_9EURO
MSSRSVFCIPSSKRPWLRRTTIAYIAWFLQVLEQLAPRIVRSSASELLGRTSRTHVLSAETLEHADSITPTPGKQIRIPRQSFVENTGSGCSVAQ